MNDCTGLRPRIQHTRTSKQPERERCAMRTSDGTQAPNTLQLAATVLLANTHARASIAATEECIPITQQK